MAINHLKLADVLAFEMSEMDFDMLRYWSSATFKPVPDKASGNMVMLRRMARTWETELLPRTEGLLLYFPETCVIHGHRRANYCFDQCDHTR